MTDFRKAVRDGVGQLADRDDELDPFAIILPILKNYGIKDAASTGDDVRESDLKELGQRWNVKLKDPKTKRPMNFEQMLQRLVLHVEQQLTGMPSAAGGNGQKKNTIITEPGGGMSLSASVESLRSIAMMGRKRKKVPNYFGLPTHAYTSNPNALVYMARKPTRGQDSVDDHHQHHQGQQQHDTEKRAEAERVEMKVSEGNFAAQRKVSEALLTMAKNEGMSKHFIHKGGVEAVMRLISESDDKQVLHTCALCLIQSTEGRPDYCKALTDKHILTNLQTLLEKGDVEIKIMVMEIVANLTFCDELVDTLVLGGVVGVIQHAIGSSDDADVTRYAMIINSNVAPVLMGADAEVAVRICMTCTKRLDIMHNYENACFVVDIFCNFTRMTQYSTLLCEEGLLPILIHLLEVYPTVDMIGWVSESCVNLSSTRKNRREISTSGIALHLDKIFRLGTPQQRAHTLVMVGNLLSSGFFHDKIAREETISTILETMLDPAQPKQFTGVSFVISQLAQVEASAQVLVHCEVVRIVLGLLRQAPPDSYTYLWTMLVAISQQPAFFEKMATERPLIQEMYKEVMDETSQQTELVAQLAYNLALHSNLYTFLSQDLIDMFVELLKELFSKNGLTIRSTVMTTIINFCTHAKSSRAGLLGKDLIPMFEDAGIENSTLNVKYVAALNIISNEENLCIKLLEAGAQKFIVSVQGTIAAMSATTGHLGKVDSELGRALTAATLHNLSLKRAVMGPGILSSLMSLLRNCKTIRVLHCVRCFANITQHPKAKIQLAKERRLVPVLTATMRSGCEEADRVQHYCALIICNVLALHVEKGIMEELCKSGAVTDLVVCTLLRINSVFTKESLGKALFNLMARADFRREMVTKLDVLAAMIELAKIENVELLELCIRSVFNITCETENYSEKISELKLPNILIARVTSSPMIPGAKPTTAIKFLCGMALANISFDRGLASELAFDKKVSDAAFSIFSLGTDEATYCAAVMLFNISILPVAKNLADSAAAPLLVSIIKRGPVSSIQIAVAALCNFSMLPVFMDQLTQCAIASMIELMGMPQMHNKIKMDALQFVYNMNTFHREARVPTVEKDGAANLYKLLKSQGTADGNEGTLYRIGRIAKEMCSEAINVNVQKKLLTDGIMSILLKLAKIELPNLKFDLACAIYSLTQGPEALKVLEWDGVDVLFWLTLHDCLNMYDPVRKNVARAFRNFSGTGNGAGAVNLAKEERSMAVLRALARSTSEDIQWQAAGALYNMLNVPEAQALLLSRGVVSLLLELAAAGYTSVRHVCSACLHLCPPEAMPDLSDPAALQLVLCLLEVDGDRFAELGEPAADILPYILGNMNSGSQYEAEPPQFTASWVAISCEVDNIFSVRKQTLITSFFPSIPFKVH